MSNEPTTEGLANWMAKNPPTAPIEQEVSMTSAARTQRAEDRSDYGVYATADVAALVEAIAAERAWENLTRYDDEEDEPPASKIDTADERRQAAWHAITPELLARVKRSEP